MKYSCQWIWHNKVKIHVIISCRNLYTFVMEICLKHGSKNILVEPKSKVTASAQYNVAHLHPQTMSLAIINFLHLTVLETEPRQDIQTHGHYSKVKVKSRSKLHDTSMHTHTNIKWLPTFKENSPDNMAQQRTKFLCEVSSILSHLDLHTFLLVCPCTLPIYLYFWSIL